MSVNEAPIELNWFDSDIAAYRCSLEDIDENQWVSAVEADLLVAGCTTPIQPPRQFLIFRASIRSLACKAGVIMETHQDGSRGLYRNIPIVEEWELPAWSSPLADIWHDNDMRLPARNGRVLEYRDVAFDRLAIEEIASRWSAAGATALGSTTPLPSIEKAGRGRPEGSGALTAEDAPLLDEMAKLIGDRTARSITAAADLVVDRAAGHGTRENKVTRLRKGYIKREKNGA